VPLLLLKLTLTPLLVGGATLAARRWGSAIGGWIVSLPLTSGPILFFLALDHGPAFAAEATTGTLLGLGAICGYCVGYLIASRHGPVQALAAASAAFVLVAVAVQPITGAPFILRDFDHWKAYRDSKLFQELAKGYDDKTKHKIVALTYYGQRHVTANKLIMKPEDMKGMKLRVPPAPLFLMFTKSVGANATPIAFAEVYLALQQGTVDGQENPLPTWPRNSTKCRATSS